MSTPSTAPNVAALQAEVHELLERLHVSNEWNMRLNQQISELTQLPPSDVQEMRQRMLDPDIAIPLLQCYDAVIQEKTEEVAQLRKEAVDLQAQLDAFHRDQLDVSSAVRMAEELAKSVQGKASAEVQRYVTAVKELQEEVVRLRLEVTRALDAENAAKQTAQHASEKTAAFEKALEAARQETARTQEALQVAEHKWKQQQQQVGDEQTGIAVQQVQQQLLQQENADKTQELERLRGKMVQALRQTTDNHAAHLRIVEERHRMVVDDLRSVNRTQELEMLKLRAQLSRWDPSNPSNMSLSAGHHNGSSGSLRMQSTSELLDAQTRQAREMEVKRLYGEVSALQLQRDDALRQYEQLTSRLQRDKDQQLQEAQRQLQSVQRTLADMRVRCDELEETKGTQETSLRQVREELRRVQQEAQQTRLSLDSQTRKLATAQQQLADAADRAAAAEEEKKSASQREEQHATEAAASVAQALQDVQAAKERAYAELEEVQRRYEQLQHTYQQVQEQLRERQQSLEKKERARSILELQMGRLEEGLETHKRRLVECDHRIRQLEAQLGEARQQQRSSCLSLEQFKIQNMQLTRARDQLAEMLQARSF